MKSVIVGTAGHIDHGKTALVKALTGIDADRLEEEKRRGITIDIGFAHLTLAAPGGETVRIGFVDVPGHERFVRNMLAGIGGIDMVLLVIAADESIKPQTREHFDIIRLLSIPRGITVLTKADLVDAETLEVVRMEVEEFLRGSFLENSPIIPVSSLTGQGLDELKRAMLETAMQVSAKDSSATFRLPIDRVFTMHGFGTVVTGTLLSGSVRKEEEVEVFPVGRRVRVRGIQVHGKPAEQASAGQRTALNLAGAATEDLSRGMVLGPPGILHATQKLDVQITLLPSAKLLKNRARVHFHAQTAETLASVRLLGKPPDSALKPGEVTFARLLLESPILLLPGDRFILRQFSPVVTIGGGTVLDPRPLRVPHPSPQARVRATMPDTDFAFDQFLPLMLSGSPEDVLHRRIARRFLEGFTVNDAVAETGWTAARVEQILLALIRARRIVRIGDKLADFKLYESVKAGIPARLEAELEKTRLSGGIGREQLRDRHTDSVLHDAMLADLVKAGKLEISGDLVRIPGKGIQLRDEEEAAKKTIEHAFASAGLKVPALKEVLAALKVDRARAQKIVTLLLRDRVLVKVSDDLVFHRDALDALRQTVTAVKAQSPRIDVARFKDLTGVTRKYAIPLLEYLDRERVTRRVGDERVIL